MGQPGDAVQVTRKMAGVVDRRTVNPGPGSSMSE